MFLDRILSVAAVVVLVPLAMVAYIAVIEAILRQLAPPAQRRLRPWLWLAPALVLLFIFLVYPTLNTIYLSFQNGNSSAFVGMENYQFVFTDNNMLTALRNNLIWLIFFTGGTVLLGLLIAILFDRVPYEAAAKALVFLPMALSFVAAGVIWKLMYDYQPPNRPQTGTLNAVVTAFGGDPVAWLIEPSTNNLALVAVGIWMWTGFGMVILSAGLKGIPTDIMEAARVDGANEWQILRNITIPMLSSTIGVVTTTMVIWALKVFDVVYVMTNGNFGTEVIANRMYKELFNARHFGRASAIAIVLFLAVLPVMMVNIKRFREQEAQR